MGRDWGTNECSDESKLEHHGIQGLKNVAAFLYNFNNHGDKNE
jgi:hypothetical protein